METNITKKSIEFEFFGQKMVLKTSDDPALVQEAIRIAELKVKEAKVRAKIAAPHQIALLALLDLAEEYVRAKHRSQKHRKQVEKKSLELLSLVEKELGIRGTGAESIASP